MWLIPSLIMVLGVIAAGMSSPPAAVLVAFAPEEHPVAVRPSVEKTAARAIKKSGPETEDAARKICPVTASRQVPSSALPLATNGSDVSAPAREQYPAYYIAGLSDKVSSAGG